MQLHPGSARNISKNPAKVSAARLPPVPYGVSVRDVASLLVKWTAMISLYHCSDARSFRPLWALEEAEVDYQLHILPFPPRVRDKSYLEINPLGTIPAFFDGETRMTESAAIVEYIAARYAPGRLSLLMDEDEFGQILNYLHNYLPYLFFIFTVQVDFIFFILEITKYIT